MSTTPVTFATLLNANNSQSTHNSLTCKKNQIQTGHSNKTSTLQFKPKNFQTSPAIEEISKSQFISS
jgi:hypothetical protein